MINRKLTYFDSLTIEVNVSLSQPLTFLVSDVGRRVLSLNRSLLFFPPVDHIWLGFTAKLLNAQFEGCLFLCFWAQMFCVFYPQGLSSLCFYHLYVMPLLIENYIKKPRSRHLPNLFLVNQFHTSGFFTCNPL